METETEKEKELIKKGEKIGRYDIVVSLLDFIKDSEEITIEGLISSLEEEKKALIEIE